MNIDEEFKEVFEFIDEWRKGSYGLIITDVEVRNTNGLCDLLLKGEYRVSCEDLFIETELFHGFYERILSAAINYGKDSGLFCETVRVVREQVIEKFNKGLKVVDEEITTAVEVFKLELLEELENVDIDENIIVVIDFNKVLPVLVDVEVEVLSGLVN